MQFQLDGGQHLPDRGGSQLHEGPELSSPDIDDLLIKCSLAAKDNGPQLFQAIKTTAGWERFLQAAEREGLAELIYYNCRERIPSASLKTLRTRDLPQTVDSRPSTVDCQKAAASAAPKSDVGGSLLASAEPLAKPGPCRPDLMPPGVFRSLEKAYLTTLACNILFLAKLEQITDALMGIDFIVLKGAYLVQHIYASPGLRRFSDIDILVKRADLTGVSRRLAQLGCLPTPTGAGFLLRQGFGGQVAKAAASSYLNSIMFHSAETNIAVHVHWHLLNSILPNYINATLDVGEIWKAVQPSQPEALLRRSRPRPFTLTLRNESASAGLALCPEHLIIHLAEHALRHSFDRLVLLRDIAEVIVKLGPAIDWDRVVADSRKFNLVRPVFYSLLLVREKTAVAVPDSALAALRPARSGRGERLFMRLALRGRRYPELGNLVYFDSLASGGEKIRFVWRLAFPPRDVLALAYGKRTDEIGPAVYLRRLFRGIGCAARAMVYHAGLCPQPEKSTANGHQ